MGWCGGLSRVSALPPQPPLSSGVLTRGSRSPGRSGDFGCSGPAVARRLCRDGLHLDRTRKRPASRTPELCAATVRPSTHKDVVHAPRERILPLWRNGTGMVGPSGAELPRHLGHQTRRHHVARSGKRPRFEDAKRQIASVRRPLQRVVAPRSHGGAAPPALPSRPRDLPVSGAHRRLPVRAPGRFRVLVAARHGSEPAGRRCQCLRGQRLPGEVPPGGGFGRPAAGGYGMARRGTVADTAGRRPSHSSMVSSTAWNSRGARRAGRHCAANDILEQREVRR